MDAPPFMHPPARGRDAPCWLSAGTTRGFTAPCAPGPPAPGESELTGAGRCLGEFRVSQGPPAQPGGGRLEQEEPSAGFFPGVSLPLGLAQAADGRLG